MNLAFGDASKPSEAYIEENYPRTENDVYAAFVERGLDRLHSGGLLDAITSRAGFFLSSFRKRREEMGLKVARPTVVTDLGQGALDTAMAEATAYALEKSRWMKVPLILITGTAKIPYGTLTHWRLASQESGYQWTWIRS